MITMLRIALTSIAFLSIFNIYAQNCGDGLSDLTTNVLACDSYTWPANGRTYRSSTYITESLTNEYGCSYSHTLNLRIGQKSSGSENVSACDSYIWDANGITYTSSGTYTAKLRNSSGCDSLATLNLNLTIEDNYNADMLGIEESLRKSLNFYPNPTDGEVIVDLGQLYGTVSVKVFTLDGQEVVVFNKSNTDEIKVDLNGAPGMYLMKVETDLNQIVVLRVVKN
ncbi:MAG: T9SS type A sorting domain-containing protein [Crocinitomicaceae bacterium]|nr:T9SS type A sorting domain-containing protein [Crocinitomicaceae bacterium]